MKSLSPILLEPTNFTPLSRTPWAGVALAQTIKSEVVPASSIAPTAVGESWEFSLCDPFQSRTLDGRVLRELIAEDPLSWCGKEQACDLLVKLIDTADRLSLQIHPAHDAPTLLEHETGKPEAWYILSAQAGAGIFLGWKNDATEDRLRQAYESGDAQTIESLLHFEPVHAGEVFTIPARTPHAIGAGIVLCEPQQVAPAKTGVTLRYWDWNRRYDTSGKPDSGGTPRALHFERALAVTDWQAPREDGADQKTAKACV